MAPGLVVTRGQRPIRERDSRRPTAARGSGDAGRPKPVAPRSAWPGLEESGGGDFRHCEGIVIPIVRAELPRVRRPNPASVYL